MDPVVVARLEALIAVSDDNDEDENVFSLIKAAPGNVSLETMLVEISVLEAIRAIGLPAALFDGIDARIIAGGAPARRSSRRFICASTRSQRSSRCAPCFTCANGRSPTRSCSC